MLSSSKIGMYLKNRNWKNQKLNFTKSSVIVQIFSNPSLPNCINRHCRFFEHGADNTGLQEWKILENSYRFSSKIGRTDRCRFQCGNSAPPVDSSGDNITCSSLGRFSKWSSVAIVALLLEFANRQFGSRGNVHESRHASTVEKGVVHQSVTAHTKISEVPYKECGIGEMGRLKMDKMPRDVICGRFLAE